jgi:hypothetical protein
MAELPKELIFGKLGLFCCVGKCPNNVRPLFLGGKEGLLLDVRLPGWACSQNIVKILLGESI